MCEEAECADCFVAFGSAEELRRHHLERHSGEAGEGEYVGERGRGRGTGGQGRGECGGGCGCTKWS